MNSRMFMLRARSETVLDKSPIWPNTVFGNSWYNAGPAPVMYLTCCRYPCQLFGMLAAKTYIPTKTTRAKPNLDQGTQARELLSRLDCPARCCPLMRNQMRETGRKGSKP